MGIDVLRLFAALLVVFYHFSFWDFGRGPPILADAGLTMPSFGPLLHFGWVGVEIFFVISGYVIAFSAHGASSRAFLRGRVLRLVPGAWICATVALLLYGGVIHRPLGAMLPGYLACLVFWPFAAIDAVYWTLGIEVSFYALVYLLIRRGRLAWLERITVAMGVASGAFWIACLGLQDMLPADGTLGILRMLVLKAEGNRYLQLCLAQHACLFGLGVVLNAASMHGLTRARKLSIALLAGACVLELLGQNGIIARTAHIDLSPLPAITAWLVAMTALCLAIRHNQAIARALGRGEALARFAGRLTYPLYLVHDPICFSLAVLLAPVLGQRALAAAIGGALIAAGIIERCLERPLRRLLDHLIFHAPRFTPVADTAPEVP